MYSLQLDGLLVLGPESFRTLQIENTNIIFIKKITHHTDYLFCFRFSDSSSSLHVSNQSNYIEMFECRYNIYFEESK